MKKSKHFETLDQIEEYFDNDELECLFCGDCKKSLSKHIKTVHGMTPDEYRLEFGIPLSRGLIGKSFHEKLSSLAEERQSNGELDIANIEKNPNSRNGEKRNFSPAHMIKFQAGAQEYNESIRLEDKAFFEILLAVKSGEKAYLVTKKEGYPSSSALGRYRKSNQKFDKVFTKALNHQANLRNKRIINLDKEGKNATEIAKILKVAKNVVYGIAGKKERPSDHLDTLSIYRDYKASGLKPKDFCVQNDLTEHYESLRKKFKGLEIKERALLDNKSESSLSP